MAAGHLGSAGAQFAGALSIRMRAPGMRGSSPGPLNNRAWAPSNRAQVRRSSKAGALRNRGWPPGNWARLPDGWQFALSSRPRERGNSAWAPSTETWLRDSPDALTGLAWSVAQFDRDTNQLGVDPQPPQPPSAARWTPRRPPPNGTPAMSRPQTPSAANGTPRRHSSSSPAIKSHCRMPSAANGTPLRQLDWLGLRLRV
ncbi:hypothetical protein GCM10009764_58910 [Nocardia ninae]|uniref:Uncharacterized protein n=1 Tax=Nocardia ninae NBRC 108245 TaxID=1210091 RepID=A0A511MLR6_9NOCA|nr:hypothetical protein NN4_60890 [Nocardia ninae NBRC 108245]